MLDAPIYASVPRWKAGLGSRGELVDVRVAEGQYVKGAGSNRSRRGSHFHLPQKSKATPRLECWATTKGLTRVYLL